MLSRILAVPWVRTTDDFASLLCHLGHHLSWVTPAVVTVAIDPAIEVAARAWLASPMAPHGVDPVVLDRVRALAPTVQFVTSEERLDDLLLHRDVVLDWDVATTADGPWPARRDSFRRGRSWFEIDWRGRRLGTSMLAEAAKLVAIGRTWDTRAVAQVEDLAARIGGADRAYLVATGPSARTALEHDLSDGVRIVCNTLVLDGELMAHVQPQVLCFADPIFHFGPSTYAQRFQRVVAERAHAYDFTIVTSERYAPMLRAHWPELEDRVIGLRQGQGSFPRNMDLRRHPAVKPYPNVLTMLMMPVATTLARSAVLYGFDGRDPDEDYFWQHGKTVQFDDEMQEIRSVHPGFFDVDYEDYYDTHVNDLNGMVTVLDRSGFRVTPGSHTFIPALTSRRSARTETIEAAATPDDERPVLLSVTPDWVGEFGHYGPFEVRLHAAAEDHGFRHLALTSTARRVDADWQLPVLTEASFGNFADRLVGEIRRVAKTVDLAAGSVVAYYTADVWHLPAFLRLAAEHPDVRFVANLMRSHRWLTACAGGAPTRADAARLTLLEECLEAAAGTSVTIAVDSPALAGDLRQMTGHEPAVWPMMAVADFEPAARDRDDDGRARVTAPVQAQEPKGFPLLVDLAERWGGRFASGERQLTARFVTGVGSPSARLAGVADRFERAGGTLLRGNLSDEDYEQLVADADVVLVPYRIDPFRTRTSGVVVDALMNGRPVVTTADTWGAELVERHGAGTTFADGDVAAMAAAVDAVLDDRERFEEAARRAAPSVREEFSPATLLRFLTGAPAPPPPSMASVERVERSSALTISLLRALEAERTSMTVDAAVLADDARRRQEHRDDVIESHKRALARAGASRSYPANQTAASAAFLPPRVRRMLKRTLGERGIAAVRRFAKPVGAVVAGVAAVAVVAVAVLALVVTLDGDRDGVGVTGAYALGAAAALGVVALLGMAAVLFRRPGGLGLRLMSLLDRRARRLVAFAVAAVAGVGAVVVPESRSWVLAAALLIGVRAVAELTTDLRVVQRRVDAADRRIRDAATTVGRSAAARAAQLDGVASEVRGLRRAMDELGNEQTATGSEGSAEVTALLDERLRATESELASIGSRVTATVDDVADVRSTVSEVDHRLEDGLADLGARVGVLRNAHEALDKRVRAGDHPGTGSSSAVGALWQPFPRVLPRSELDRIRADRREQLGVDIDRRVLGHWAQRLVHLEASGAGRAPAAVGSVLDRLFVLEAAASAHGSDGPLRIVEHGSIHGVTARLTAAYLDARGIDNTITLAVPPTPVDTRDPVTGALVGADVLAAEFADVAGIEVVDVVTSAPPATGSAHVVVVPFRDAAPERDAMDVVADVTAAVTRLAPGGLLVVDAYVPTVRAAVLEDLEASLEVVADGDTIIARRGAGPDA